MAYGKKCSSTKMSSKKSGKTSKAMPRKIEAKLMALKKKK